MKLSLEEFRKTYKNYHLLWSEEEVSKLIKFLEVLKSAKGQPTDYLIVSEDVIGFTDTVRAVALKATHIHNQLRPLGFYSEDLISLLKNAKEIAVLEDYSLAILLKDKVEIISPKKESVFNIASCINTGIKNVETAYFHTDDFQKNIGSKADLLSWKAICSSFDDKDLNTMYPKFYFTKEGIEVKATLGKSHLEMIFPISIEHECHRVFNPKFIDLWIKAVSNLKTTGILHYKVVKYGAICFEIQNLKYMIMPIVWRD